MLKPCLPMLPLLLLVLPAAAQPASHECAVVPDPAARLACYDRAFPPPPETVQAATEKAQAEFGLDAAEQERSLAQQQPERIESPVAKVDQGSRGRVFILENGQVWAQTETRTVGHVRPGDVVQVRKAILGGYTLVMPNGVSVRVRRTR